MSYPLINKLLVNATYVLYCCWCNLFLAFSCPWCPGCLPRLQGWYFVTVARLAMLHYSYSISIQFQVLYLFLLFYWELLKGPLDPSFFFLPFIIIFCFFLVLLNLTFVLFDTFVTVCAQFFFKEFQIFTLLYVCFVYNSGYEYLKALLFGLLCTMDIQSLYFIRHFGLQYPTHTDDKQLLVSGLSSQLQQVCNTTQRTVDCGSLDVHQQIENK